jgi:hypothetical protein
MQLTHQQPSTNRTSPHPLAAMPTPPPSCRQLSLALPDHPMIPLHPSRLRPPPPRPLIPLAVACLLAVCHAHAADYYVDPMDGWNTNPGTIGQPVRTVARAAQLANPGDRVILRGGIYRETLTPARSGQPGAPIIFSSYPGEDVVVSAFEPLSGWSDAGNGVYRAQLFVSPYPHVLIDGVSAIEARYPNHTSWQIIGEASGTVTSTSNSGAVAAGADTIRDTKLPNGLPADWLQGARVAYKDWFRAWSTGILNVTAFNPVTKDITMNAMIQYSNAGRQLTAVDAFRYVLIGSKGLIDVDREWAFERNEGFLYLKTPGGRNPSEFLIEVPTRREVVNLSGRSHIHIENIKLVGGRILANAQTTNCVMNGLAVTYATGTHDINGSANEISDSVFADSIEGSISLNGTRHRFVNNWVREVGGRGGRSLYLRGSEHLVAYNTLERAYQSLINMSTTWRCQILHNEFSDASLGVEDMGALYTVFNGGMTQIAYNRFWGDYRKIPHTYGIYLDGGASHYQVHHNVSWMNLLNEEKLGIMYFNNTIYRWKDYGSTVAANRRISDQQLLDEDLAGSLWLNNLYAYAYVPPPGQPGIHYLDQVAAIAGSVFNDDTGRSLDTLPDPRSYDFTLRAGSPAIDAGFPIDGITDGYVGTAPDLGAFEFGQPAWQSGHNFVNKPVIAYSFPPDRRPNRFVNLLRNGGFDEYNESTSPFPWTIDSGSVSLQFSEWGWPPLDLAYLAYYSLRIWRGAGRVTQQVDAVAGGRTYSLTAVVRATDPNQSVELGVTLPDGSSVTSSRTAMPITANTWTRLMLQFTLPEGTHSLVVHLAKTSTDDLSVYFDEVILCEAFPSVVQHPGSLANATTYIAAADTYIEPNSTADFSLRPQLLVRTGSSLDRKPFIQFDLEPLRGRTIAQAVLKLWGRAPDRNWRLSIRPVTSEWTTSGPSAISWTNQPSIGSSIATVQLQGSRQDRTPVAVTVDLTEFIRSRLAADGRVGLTIEDIDRSSQVFTLTSRDLESLTPPHAMGTPALDIVFTAPPKPASPSASTSILPDQVHLMWAPTANTIEYRIVRADAPSGLFAVVGTSSSANFTDTSAIAGKTYRYRILAVNESAVSPASDIVTVAMPNHTFELWAAHFGLTPGVNDGPAQDPDMDGIPNLLEFMLGSNPLQGDPSRMPSTRIANGRFELAFKRNTTSVASVNSSLLYSFDLKTWSSLPIGATSSSTGNFQLSVVEDVPGRQNVTISLPVEASQAVFSQLELNRQ